MNRITSAFARTRQEGRAALVGYLTAFDPDADASTHRIMTACEAGLDVLELGVPFSDPSADGPEIQGAMVRALKSGATLRGVLDIAAQVRSKFDIPIVLFGYANPLLQYGPKKLAVEAAAAGVDGLLVVDMPPDFAKEIRGPAVDAGLGWTGLVAPTSTPDRIAAVAASSQGFIYAVALRGVTGAALNADAPELQTLIEGVRAHSDLPVAVGFGVRQPEQARVLAQHADGVVVGTALIQAAREGNDALAARVGALRAALQRS